MLKIILKVLAVLVLLFGLLVFGLKVYIFDSRGNSTRDQNIDDQYCQIDIAGLKYSNNSHHQGCFVPVDKETNKTDIILTESYMLLSVCGSYRGFNNWNVREMFLITRNNPEIIKGSILENECGLGLEKDFVLSKIGHDTFHFSGQTTLKYKNLLQEIENGDVIKISTEKIETFLR